MTPLTELALHLPRPLFNRHDIVNHMPLKGSHALDGLIKRAIASGEILHVRKGLYCLSPKFGKTVHPYSMAQRIYGPSYLSLEVALSLHGWIPEAVYTLTSVCDRKTTDFETPLGLFTYTRVPQMILFEQVVTLSTLDIPAMVATPLKALCDYVYVHKKDWKGMSPVMDDLRIEPDRFETLDRTAIEVLMNNYRSQRIQRFLDGLRKDLTR